MCKQRNKFTSLFLFFLLMGCSINANYMDDPRSTQGNLPPERTASLPIETKIYLPIVLGPAQSSNIQNLPITIVSFENYQLKFTCISPGECPVDISLDKDLFNNTTVGPGPVLYGGPQSIYAIFGSTSSQEISAVHINTEMRSLQYRKLPLEQDSLVLTVAEDHLVVAGYKQKQIYILDENLEMQVVNVSIPVTEFVATGEKSVIAFNGYPARTDNSFQIEFVAIDVLSGDIIQEISKHVELGVGPDENKFVEIDGVSPDLKEFYCLYTTSDRTYPLRLGKFDTNSGKELRAIPISTVFVTTGFSQYHNSLYTSNAGDGYGGPASLFDMVDLESILNSNIVPEYYSGKLIVRPFGTTFLLGMFMKVIQITSNGEIIGEYDLPKEWINEKYKLMYYMR